MAEDRPLPRFKPVDRRQLMLRTVDVEALIEEDHPARAVWAFTGRMDWTRFSADAKAVEGTVGRSAWDPRLLGSLWIYAYSRGISSARELARRCAYEPAFQWLTGLQQVNYHTLADFRVDFKEPLDELFVQALGLLSAEGLITMERVVHDGTKIRACAGHQSYRREARIRDFLEAARLQVEAMGDPRAEPSAREKAARERAQRDREARLEQALTELEAIQKTKGKDPSQVRVSTTDPQARIMKQSNGGFYSSYNVQISTDTAQGMIVSVGISQSSNDVLELAPAMDRLEQTMGRKPQQVIADGGFTNRQSVQAMEDRKIDFIGSIAHSNPSGTRQAHGIEEAFDSSAFIFEPELKQYRCPAGHVLRHKKKRPRKGGFEHTYRATACEGCPFKPRCCPTTKGCRSLVRIEDAGAWKSFLGKMGTDSAKTAYRLRRWMAEFPNAWLKEKIGLRQFHVRGLQKVGIESIWACLTYNIQQWIRLSWNTHQCRA